MIRTIILLSPAYISLFWAIVLYSNKRNASTASQFLSVFMVFALVCFFGQFLFFAPHPDVFPYFEPVMAYFGSLVFPLYYIYFRLLTVDDKFSYRKHTKYLIVPFLIAFVYTVGILLTPWNEYKAWLYNESLFPDSPYIGFLRVMRKIVKLTFLILLIITYILNSTLLKKYAHKAEQYYSDINDGKYNNAKKLNYFLLIVSLSSFIAMVAGRKLLLPKDTIIYTIWLIFTFSVYGIGYMGYKQKPVNPTFESENDISEITPGSTELNLSQKLILKKLLDEFEMKKIHKNCNLNITNVVQNVGSNRTYISTLINQQFNQNFCSFVNNYRLIELEEIYSLNPSLSNELLAEQSGFGSTNSMKRAIVSKTGYSISEWKNSVLKKNLSAV